MWSNGRFNGGYIPCMRETRNPEPLFDRTRSTWHPTTTEMTREAKVQPYIKLHGSSRWFSNGDELLIMGANKHAAIERHRVLKSYHDEFRRCLALPNTRLVVIGYSFQDEHINSEIYESWQQSRFRMMVIDPNGRDVVRNKKTLGNKIYLPLSIEEIDTTVSARRLRD